MTGASAVPAAGAPEGAPVPSAEAEEASPFFSKSCPPMPEVWREPNAADDLIAAYPER